MPQFLLNPLRYTCICLAVLFAAVALAGCQTYREAMKPDVQSSKSTAFDPAAHSKIAVLALDNTGGYRGRSGLVGQVEDVFMSAAIGKGYTLADRSNTEEVMEEMEFQASGVTGQDYAELGEMLNVSAILVAGVNETSITREEDALSSLLGEENPKMLRYAKANVSGRLISVAEGEVLWVGSYTGKVRAGESRNVNEAVPEVARIVADALPNLMDSPATR